MGIWDLPSGVGRDLHLGVRLGSSFEEKAAIYIWMAETCTLCRGGGRDLSFGELCLPFGEEYETYHQGRDGAYLLEEPEIRIWIRGRKLPFRGAWSCLVGYLAQMLFAITVL